MCFYVGSNQAKIAKNDIHCYKIGKIQYNKCVSYYLNFPYTKGRTYIDDNAANEINNCDTVYFAFHSYSKKYTKFKKCNGRINIYFAKNILKKLFNIDLELICDYSNSELAIIKCTIPKGSTYCENDHGEIVSDAIHIDNIKLIKL